jgi:hypothetical protein
MMSRGNVVVQQQKPDEPISKLERLSALKEKGMISDRVRGSKDTTSE